MSPDRTTTGRFELFSADEIAHVAGADPQDVRALIESGRVLSFRGLVAPADAAALVRRLSQGASEDLSARSPFSGPAVSHQPSAFGHAISLAVHAVALLMLAFGTTLGLFSDRTEERVDRPVPPARLVYLMVPGPGGGGGGGGLQQEPPPSAPAVPDVPRVRATPTPVVTVRRPPPRYVRSTARLQQPIERRVEPIDRESPDPVLPPMVQAPIAPAAPPTPRLASMGLMASVSPHTSAGLGLGGGAGSGRGSGSGPGAGPGLDTGSGGGTGGGPFQPGSGIDPPRLVREIRPTYTEEGRRRGLEGDVDLEVVVAEDGRVSSIRVLNGLGGGLDQRAVEAVRQWRFSPARRRGQPVAVVVQVAVEFSLR